MTGFSSVVEEDLRALASDLAPHLEPAKGSTCLVTGAAGFLMSYVVEVLTAAGVRVLAVDNFKTGSQARLRHLEGDRNVRFITHDITGPLALDEAAHWFVHGASIASPSVYRRFPLETLDANVGGTRMLLELARQGATRGFVFVSTSEIYGDPDSASIPTPEDYRGVVSCTGPRACYDEGKRLGETLAMTYFRQFGTPVKIVRPFNVYGPGLRLDDQRVLPDFMTKVLAGAPIALLSDGRPTRAFCYVTDAVALIVRVLLAGAAGEAFNVGNDEREISMLDLAGLTARVGSEVSHRPPVEVTASRSDDAEYLTDNPQRRCADLTKARRTFPDWSPGIGLEAGLARTFRHHLERSA